MQQRAGVQLLGGVGQVGDVYEQNADAVADAVVRGESAAALLSPAGSTGRNAVQRKRAAGESSPKSQSDKSTAKAESAAAKDPSYASAWKTQQLIQYATNAEAAFKAACEQARLAGDAMTTIAEAHKNNTALKNNYRAAAEGYAESKQGDEGFAKVLGIMGMVVSLATGIGTVVTGLMGTISAIKTASKVWEEAKEAHKLATLAQGLIPGVESVAKPLGHVHFLTGAYHAGAKAKKLITAGVSVRTAGKSLQGLDSLPPIDAAANMHAVLKKALSSTNGILGDALKLQLRTNLLTAQTNGATGRRQFGYLKKNVAILASKPLLIPHAQSSILTKKLEAALAQARKFEDQMTRTKQRWGAYAAGGAETLSNESGERGLFRKVAAWKRAGGAKDLSKHLHVAVDEQQWTVRFDTEDFKSNKSGSLETKVGPNFTAYAFRQRIVKSESGMLGCSSPEAYAAVVQWLGNGAMDPTPGVVGEAEGKVLIGLSALQGGRISVSTARALASLGIAQKRSPARVVLHFAGMKRVITGAPSGNSIRDGWVNTPEFLDFWHNTLGGKWSNIYNKDAKKRVSFQGGAQSSKKTRARKALSQAKATALIKKYYEQKFARTIDISTLNLKVIYASNVRAAAIFSYKDKDSKSPDAGWESCTFDIHHVPMNNGWVVMSNSEVKDVQRRVLSELKP